MFNAILFNITLINNNRGDANVPDKQQRRSPWARDSKWGRVTVKCGEPFLIKFGMSFTTLVIVILQRGARLIGWIHSPRFRIVYTFAPSIIFFFYIFLFICLLTCSQDVIS